MKIVKPAAAGTLESSDILITLKPGDGTVDIQLTSSVDVYYHDTIMQVLKDALEEMGVTSAQVQAVQNTATAVLSCCILHPPPIANSRAVPRTAIPKTSAVAAARQARPAAKAPPQTGASGRTLCRSYRANSANPAAHRANSIMDSFLSGTYLPYAAKNATIAQFDFLYHTMFPVKKKGKKRKK